MAREMLPTSFDLDGITPDMVEKIYSGRPGCGCGCNGNYYEPGDTSFRSMLTRTVNVFRERRNEVGVQDLLNGSLVLFIEDDTRYRWLYLKAAA